MRENGTICLLGVFFPVYSIFRLKTGHFPFKRSFWSAQKAVLGVEKAKWWFRPENKGKTQEDHNWPDHRD